MPHRLLMLAALICALPAAEPIVTVLPATGLPAAVPPGWWFRVDFHFDAAGPLERQVGARVELVDEAGKTVDVSDHPPEIAGTAPAFIGAVRDSRILKVGEKVPDGTYRVALSLRSRQLGQPLTPGAGVEALEGNRYVVGRLTVDRAAPRPKADSEGPRTLDLSGYELAFDEGFDGALDVSAWGPGTRWSAHTPWKGDFGDALFADPVLGFPFTVKDGILGITAHKGRDGRWSAGLLSSLDPKGQGFAQMYGYFEMRAKLPKEPGVWPGFWLIEANDRTDPHAIDDGSIEIDILEYYGAVPDGYSCTVHTWKPAPHRSTWNKISTLPGQVADGFHTYGALVTPETITMYMDGAAVWTTATPPEHKKPLGVLVDLALQKPLDRVPDPSLMEVDYVRAYRPRAGATQAETRKP
jgi:hypothetical protein